MTHRMSTVWWSLCAALAVGLVGASGATATAPPPQATFTLDASHGYTITGFGTDAFATLTAAKGHSEAGYSPRPPAVGKGTARRMKLDLGSMGGFDLRFHAKRTKRVPPPAGCKGKDGTKKIGTWKGLIKFRGEDGYTSVRSHKADGSVLFPKHWRCRGPQGRKGVQLLAVGGPATAPTKFTAFRPDGTKRSELLATKSGLEKAGDVKVGFFRSVALTGPASAFTFSDDLTSAHVAPAGPFSGSADFLKPNGWSGSLEVSFPGETHVKLARPDFGATLARGKFQ